MEPGEVKWPAAWCRTGEQQARLKFRPAGSGAAVLASRSRARAGQRWGSPEPSISSFLSWAQEALRLYALPPGQPAAHLYPLPLPVASAQGAGRGGNGGGPVRRSPLPQPEPPALISRWSPACDVGTAKASSLTAPEGDRSQLPSLHGIWGDPPRPRCSQGARTQENMTLFLPQRGIAFPLLISRNLVK